MTTRPTRSRGGQVGSPSGKVSTQWVTARSLIVAMGGNPKLQHAPITRAVYALASAGTLRAIASRYNDGSGASKDSELPSHFWDHISAEDWNFGNFTSLRSGQPEVALGVRFAKEDVDEIAAPAEPSSKRRKGIGGAKPNVVGWTAFSQAIVKISQEGRLNSDCFPSQRELRDEVLLEISDHLSASTIKSAVASIWNKWCQ